MKRLLLFTWLLLSSVFLCAQGLRYDSVANSTATIAGVSVTTPLPGATVTVCSIPQIAAATGGASESGNVVTITTTAPHGLLAGQSVIIQDVAVAGYNGTFTIATAPGGAGSTTFTYINGTTGLGSSGGGFAIPNAKPCTNTATIYSDPGLASALPNPITADAQGNFGFWAPAGTYVYTVTGSGIAGSGPYFASLGGGAGGSNTFAQINKVFLIDGTTYAKTDVGLQAALNAASAQGGGEVWHTQGNIQLAASVSVPSNVTLHCSSWGATITAPAGVSPALALGTSSAQVTDSRVTGCNLIGPNGSVSGTSGGVAIQLDGSRLTVDHNKIAGFAFAVSDDIASGTDLDVHDNWISTAPTQGILLSANKVRITNNRIDAVGTTNQSHGVYVSGATDVVVDTNQISNISGFCVQVFNSLGSHSFEGVVVSHNTCNTAGTATLNNRGGIIVAQDQVGQTCHKVVIDGNTLENLNPTIASAPVAIEVDGCSDVSITANVGHNLGDSEGINVVAAVVAATQITISGNVMDGFSASGTGNGIHVIAAAALSNITIGNNTIFGASQSCLYLDGAGQVTVNGNQFIQCDTSGVSAQGILEFHSGSGLSQIFGNNITTATVGQAGINVAGNDNEVFGNTLIGTAGISDGGTRSVIFGNKLNATDADFYLSNPIFGFEIPAPTCLATFDAFWPDSTAHRWKMCFGSGAADTVVGAATTDTFSNKSTAAGPLTGTVGSGTATTAGTAIGAGTSQTLAITVSGALTTDVAQCSTNAAYPATWLTGITVLPPVVTANTVTLTITNPSAGSITPVAQTFRCTVTR